MDALEIVADEVALEGLDGITVNSLWVRLENRHPVFPLTLDPKTKDFLWKSLVCNTDITFYELPKERSPVALFDRFSEIDPNTGIEQVKRMPEMAGQEDVYPVSMVLDDKGGVQGSCLYYKERRDINALIRSTELEPCLTLEQAHKRWREKLVIVASQALRYRSLIGPNGDPGLKLPDQSYCVLERLGRARWQGEIQRDLHTLSFKTDAGKMHYMRRFLDRNGLITLQSHVVRLPSGGQQYSILLLLKRFHVDRRSKYDILMESTSNILSAHPNNMCSSIQLRQELHVEDHTFKKVCQYMLTAKMLEVHTIPLQQLKPDEGPFKTKRGTDVLVRCLKLIRAYGQKEAEEEDENEEDAGKRSNQPEARDMERDVLSQAYQFVVASGTRGISQRGLQERMNVGSLDSRMICRILERNNMIKGFMEDEGRQRTMKYISKLHVEHSHLNKQYEAQSQLNQQLRNNHDNGAAPLPKPKPNPQVTVEEEVAKKEHRSKGKAPPKMAVSVVSLLKQSTPHKKKTPPPLEVTGTQSEEPCEARTQEESTADHAANPGLIQSQDKNKTSNVVEEVLNPPKVRGPRKGKSKPRERPQETYRLIKRKNLIIETVRNLKIVEGLFTLQKMLMDKERQDGVSTKVCKKSILRLIGSLAREGMLKFYTTTVIQDGVSKKVEFVVHPSVPPDDALVKSAIEQVRFRMASTMTASHRLRPGPEEERRAREGSGKDGEALSGSPARGCRSKLENKMGFQPLKDFRPTIVPGLSRSLGFQPKMPRFRMVHTYLWYLIYGHPFNSNPTQPEMGADRDTVSTETCEEPFKVYVDEVSWRRYIPPLSKQRDFGQGWGLISDILISLPLSLYVQIIQISYKIEGLELYLDDPMKQHYLIRFLPSQMKRQLLHKRKYVFAFHDILEKLCFMGLMQFGPLERFQEKDQVFIYIKTHATIVDTTTCEPHYKLATGTRPFERRSYSFQTTQDVENYWFDLMCVCLNTPLGVVRGPRNKQGEGEREEAEVTSDRITYDNLLYTLKGSRDIIDDGVTPGDGQGAAGLDSAFFSHLRRNWFWASYLLNKPKRAAVDTEISKTLRLRNILLRHPLPKPVDAAKLSSNNGQSLAAPPAVTEEEVQLGTEPKSRNEQVRGGKKQKRKRAKKEVVKALKKKRKVAAPPVRGCYDEVDKRALLLMTRQRVNWNQQEDSLLMLCRVASHFLNRKIKKPFVPWHVVRDIMHAAFEFSRDKTSLAVGRRSRYIMKNPQTFLNYKICLAEVYQDTAFTGQYLNETVVNSDPKVCAERFKEFLYVLRQKFSSSSGSRDILIPDTKEELFNKFKVYAIGEERKQGPEDIITSKKDIHSLVLINLIQSTLALSNSQMKSCRSFQAFQLYSKYKESVLVQVFQKCQKRGLVSRRRKDKIYGPKKSRALPILPMSYQLSQSYYRRFTWRFPRSLFNEVCDYMENVLQTTGVDGPNTFTFQADGDGVGARDNSATTGGIAVPIDGPGGACLASLSLITLGLVRMDVSIPQQIVVVDSNLVDNEVVKKITKELNEVDDDDEGDESASKGKVEVRACQASHTNYLLMRGFFVPGIISCRNLSSSDSIVVNSCAVRLQQRNTPSHNLFSEASTFFSAMSHVSLSSLPAGFLRVLRGTEVTNEASICEDAGLESRCMSTYGYNAADLQVALALRAAVKDHGEFGLDRKLLCRTFTHLEEAMEGRSRTLQQYIQDLIELEELVEVGALSHRLVCACHATPWLLHISESVCDKGDMEQLTRRQLKRPARADDAHLSLPKKRPAIDTDDNHTIVKETLAKEVILDEGGDEETVATVTVTNKLEGENVAKETIAEETVAEETVAKETDGQRGAAEGLEGGKASAVRGFVARPWRVVDGELNEPVCKGMLDALLHHVMSRPGLPERTLLQHYNGVLQPTAVLDLLQVLIELGCVRKRWLVGRPKPSLFSAWGGVQVRAEWQEEGESSAFYEPTAGCSLLLSRLLPHQPCWNKWVQFSPE